MIKQDYFDRLVNHWPSAIVARSEVCRFTGGVISGKTLANLASQGEAVPEAIRIGNKIAYDSADLAAWLRKRSQDESLNPKTNTPRN